MKESSQNFLLIKVLLAAFPLGLQLFVYDEVTEGSA